MIKRVKVSQNETIWVRKQNDDYLPYRSFLTALFRIASPSLMSIYKQNELKLVYDDYKFKH